ncbi:MAG: DUF1570 domain-containing protein [Planctomyces sp.]|nr:DUF1570 domain-containing protein [Planctomyces sp.]
MNSASPSRSPRFKALARTVAAFLLAVLFLAEPVRAESARLVEVSDESQTYVGKVITSDNEMCCLIERTGHLRRLPVSSLKSFRVIGEQFVPLSAGQMCDELRREIGQGYEVGATTHYVICAPSGKGQAYQSLFEEIYRAVEKFYRVRGFRTTEPDGPLVAVVFASQSEFANYCRRDDVAWSDGLRGYYSLRSNRVILFDDPVLFQNASVSSNRAGEGRGTAAVIYPGLRPEFQSMISGTAADTVIHETTHQVGFNIGIHSRLGGTPQWIIEGLATVLEAPGMRRRSAAHTLSDRINSERLDWFRTEYQPRRKLGDLATLIASDEPFQRSVLDTYSHAWAFTFFLTDNPVRSRQFMTFIQRSEQQTAGVAVSAEDRLKLFQEVFGDIARVEVDFQRWMDRLE